MPKKKQLYLIAIEKKNRLESVNMCFYFLFSVRHIRTWFASAEATKQSQRNKWAFSKEDHKEIEFLTSDLERHAPWTHHSEAQTHEFNMLATASVTVHSSSHSSVAAIFQ